jgi:glycosyltransferase involved in cell wall biosynthesis
MLDIRREISTGEGQPASTEEMRLGYLVPEFPGQTHIFFWREIGELKKLGVDVQLVSTRMPDASIISHSWSDDAVRQTLYLKQLGIHDAVTALWSLPVLAQRELREIMMRGSRKSRIDILLCIPLAGKLLRECERRGIGHVHVHSCGRAALIAAVANRIGGLNYSLTLHGPLQDYGPLQDFKWRHARFASVITHTLKAEVEAELAGNLPDRLIVQPMGVDTQQLARDTAYKPFEQSQRLRIFACGRLHIVKGHQVLIEAAGQLRDRGFDVQLRIAGEDEYQGNGFRKELAGQIDRLGLAQNVELLGAVDELEVKRNILNAHIFALASMHEPLGVAYMEAMSCETPVVGTDAGGVRELIDDEVDGVLVPPGDAHALANALESLALDPERAARLGRNGRRKILEKFSSARGAQTLKQAIFS